MASKTVVEALPNTLSATTMTLFLYQTRTLANLQWTKRPIALPQLRRTVRRRLFSCSTARHVDNSEQVETTIAAAPEEKKGPTIRRTTVMHSSGPQFSGDFYGLHTASQSVVGKPQKEQSIVRRVYRPEDTERQADIPWETKDMVEDGFEDMEASEFYNAEEDIFEEENEDDAWTRKSDPSQDRQTTITPSERAAFETIFENIRNKTKNAQRYDAFDDETPLDPAASQRAKARLEGILGNAMTADIPRTRDEKQIIVNRYPPSLRALAAKAVGLDFDESHYEEATKEEEEVLDSDQLEELRKPIRESVEVKMRAAKTDFDLWAVMEAEVFPLISRLGLEGTEQKETPPKKRVKKAKVPKPAKTLKTEPGKLALPSEKEQIPQFEPIVHEGQVVSPLAFYGPLYPSYLLLGLRILDRSFAKPSPLTLSILPKIKSLGLISHVLGASTQLYNELLIIYWYRYDDFRGAINLLSEIEQSGLNFNKETLEIVEDIRNMQIRILRGDRGETLKALWSLPEFAPGKFGYWQRKITKMLNERSETEGRLAY